MGSSSYKKRMGPIEKQGVVQAYTMLVPTVLLAVGVILLGFFNGEVVSQFLVPIIPESFLR